MASNIRMHIAGYESAMTCRCRQFLFMKTLKVFEKIRQNTTLGVIIKSKINIDESLLIPTLLYTSECYWSSRSDMRQ